MPIFKLAKNEDTDSQPKNKKIKTVDKVLNTSLMVGGIFYGGMVLQDAYDIHNDLTVVVEHRSGLTNKNAYAVAVVTDMAYRSTFVAMTSDKSGITMTATPNTQNAKENITFSAGGAGKREMVEVPISKTLYSGHKKDTQWTAIGSDYRINVSERSYPRSFVDAIFNSILEW